VQASSSLAGAAPSLAVDGRVDTAWKSDPADGTEQQLTFDFGQPREFGGLVLRWQAGAYASHYDVQFSDDAQQWRTVRSVSAVGEESMRCCCPMPRRAICAGVPRRTAARLWSCRGGSRGLAFGASPNAFFETLAKEYPRGYFARGFSVTQSYWTIVGIEAGSDTGLLSEDGALEVAKGGFSIEPFVRTDSAS
jgi:hypothetical protein